MSPAQGRLRSMVGVATGIAAAAATGCGEASTVQPAGPEAAEIARLWWVMLVLGTAMFAVVAAVLLRVLRRRSRPAEGDGIAMVVGGGVVLPLVVLVPLVSLVILTSARISPRSGPVDEEVEVTAHQFWWEVRYPGHGVVTANEIHIPVGQSVRVELGSEDVIHSFWVPRLAGKIDMIPGQETELRIRADDPGTYRGICAEYCGIQHARMQFLVIAQSEEAFADWIEAQRGDSAEPDDELAARGRDAFIEVGCGACHTIRGTEASGRAGPDLTHLATRATLGAATVENNRGNLGGWIADSQSIKPGNLMPPIPMTPEELRGILAYLEGLDARGRP